MNNTALEVIRAAEAALSEAQENVIGTDDLSADGATESLFYEPLKLCREWLAANAD